MGSPNAAVRAAFVTKLQTLASLPSVAWENVAFSPVTGVPYLRPFLLPGEPFQAELGTAGCNRHTGIYQISVYSPAGAGVLSLNTLVASIVDHFKRGTTLTYSTTTLTIQKAYPGPMMQETDWVHVPITIQYSLLASN
jgi:hypothetical protein